MDYGPHIVLTTPNQATEPSLALTLLYQARQTLSMRNQVWGLLQRLGSPAPDCFWLV